MEHGDIDQLADQEGDHRTGDDPEALAEDQGERALDVGDPEVTVGLDPEPGGREGDDRVGGDEGVADERDGDPGDQPHAPHTEVFIDDVGHHEDEGPQQHARGEAEVALHAEQRPLHRLDAEGALEREDLAADEVRQQRVDEEEPRQHDEQPIGLEIGGAHGAVRAAALRGDQYGVQKQCA